MSAVLAVLLFAACRSPHVLLTPVPQEIQRIEGHASLVLSVEGQKARSKFSFAFQLPGKGRISVSNFLGQTLYQILSLEGEAYFILPGKRAYWRAGEEEIFEKFLGFPLSLSEVIALISGEWAGLSGPRGWNFERDPEGRIIEGRRRGLSFGIEQFIGKTAFPKSLVYSHTGSEGRMRMISLRLNSELPDNVFGDTLLKRFTRKTWEEIEALIQRP